MPKTPPSAPAHPLTARLIHVVGRQNHGKTELILELVSALRGRGLTVGTIKHTSHEHELDRPGKDSHRHRLAGAAPVAVVTGSISAVYLPGLDPQGPYEALAPLFDPCDVVLVEGHLDGPGAKLEVWRRALGSQPLAASREDILALVTDDSLDMAGLTLWPRRSIDDLVDHMYRHPVLGLRLRAPSAQGGLEPK